MKNRGFSLLELLVSFLIFEVIMATSMSEVLQYIKSSRDNQIRTEAAGAAQYVLDELRSINPANLPSTGAGTAQSVTIGEHSFQVVPDYCTEASLCTGTGIRQIRVTVSMAGKVWYVVDTAYAQLR